jgi:hypothetical protein
MKGTQMSFAQLEIAERLLPDNVLIKVNALIDWSAFHPLLTGLCKREFSKAGEPEPHDA